MSGALVTSRRKGTVFFPWGPAWCYGVGVADGQRLRRHILPGSDRIVSYHTVTGGPIWAAVDGESPMRLEPSDIVVLQRVDAYEVVSPQQYPTPYDEQDSTVLFEAMSWGARPPVVTDGSPDPERSGLICGLLGWATEPDSPLLSTLHRLTRVPASDGADDPVVGRAVAVLHQVPGRSWTVQDLARTIGVSRFMTSRRFARIAGLLPTQSPTRWRMHVAAEQLRDSGEKVLSAPVEVGSDSEAAFSRAFERETGLTPRAWRERVRGAQARSQSARFVATRSGFSGPGADGP